MIRIAESADVYLDKEINVSMTVGDLAVIYALVAVTSNETARGFIKGGSGTVFPDESTAVEVAQEADMQQMYQDVGRILKQEGVVLYL